MERPLFCWDGNQDAISIDRNPSFCEQMSRCQEQPVWLLGALSITS